MSGESGRGAWNRNGVGGTLSTTGKSRGGFYALSAGELPLVGRAGLDNPEDVNAYAVTRAVVAWQQIVDVEPDGLLGKRTAGAIASWQAAHELKGDGVVGPVTARAMLLPAVEAAVAPMAAAVRATVAELVRGHVTIESGWDVGAVGVETPADLGLGQINGDAHPELSASERHDPAVGLRYVGKLVRSNLDAFDGREVDAVAAYMLGQGGCRTWIKAGRPAAWQRVVAGTRRTVYVRRYVDAVLAAR